MPKIAPAPKQTCDDLITFGHSSKRISDIFPEECGQTVLQWDTVEKHEADKNFVAGFRDGWEAKEMPKPSEPEDVPAVKVKPYVVRATDTAAAYEKGFSDWCPDRKMLSRNPQSGNLECSHPRYECSDKSRILLTAEDGKKWCHKVKP